MKKRGKLAGLAYELLATPQGASSAETDVQKKDGEKIVCRHILSNPR